MWIKYLLKLKILVYNLKNNILYEIIFSSNSFVSITTWRTTIMFSWLRRSIEGHKWLILEWSRWMAKNVCSSSFSVYRTCREIWWSFFFCCEVSFSVRSRFWIFFPRFSFMDFFDFWISPLPSLLKEDTSIYRWG